MKKNLCRVLSLALITSSFGMLSVNAAESTTAYEENFNEAKALGDFTLIEEGELGSQTELVYDSENCRAQFATTGSKVGYLLPEGVNQTNYVMEADFSYSETENYAGDKVHMGFIFAYEDPANYSEIVYRTADGAIIMYNSVDGVLNTRYEESGKGYGAVGAKDTTYALKLVVNNGYMEFYINDELCYTYNSPDDSRASSTPNVNSSARNFAAGGRVGIFGSSKNVDISFDNVVVRDVLSSDVSYYSNSFIDPTLSLNFADISTLISDYKATSFINNNWGHASYSAQGYSWTGKYLPTSVSGDYSIDMDFILNNPLNDSRHFGIIFGLKNNGDGTISYNAAGVHANGKMYLNQVTDVADGKGSTVISNANQTYGSCTSTIDESKINPEYNADNADGNEKNYFLSYLPEDYTEPTDKQELAEALMNMRHKAKLTVTDGVAEFTFGGTTITCDIDVNSTDGYIGLLGVGTGANIISLRVAPTDNVNELPTTPTAAPTEAPEDTTPIMKYSQTFSDESSIKDIKRLSDGAFGPASNMTYNAEGGNVMFSTGGPRAGYLLPAGLNKTNYVMQADMSYKKTDEYTNAAVLMGMIFAYEDNNNFSAIGYRPTDGSVIMFNAIDGKVYTRYEQDGRGYSAIGSEDTVYTLKLIVNNGLMEFFINDEFVYAYNSPDNARMAADIADNAKARNFADGGRVGFYLQSDKVNFSVDNVRVRNIEDTDAAYYSNSFIDPNIAVGMNDISDMDSDYKATNFINNNWGYGTYTAQGYSWTGKYLPTSVSGDYSIDLDFMMYDPLNDSRHFGIIFGLKNNSNGTISYNVAGVHSNGKMYLNQVTDTADGTNGTIIADANQTYGTCVSTIDTSKINPAYDADYVKPETGDSMNHFLTYLPKDYTAPADSQKALEEAINMRHHAKLIVKDGVASFTFGGTTISCDIDTNSTSGYVGLRGVGAGARVISLRVAPYSVDEPVTELKTTMVFDYYDIADDITMADIIVNDEEEIVGENTKIILAAYENGVLIGTSIGEIKESKKPVEMEVEYTCENVDNVTIRAFLWDISVQKPLVHSVSPV